MKVGSKLCESVIVCKEFDVICSVVVGISDLVVRRPVRAVGGDGMAVEDSLDDLCE